MSFTAERMVAKMHLRASASSSSSSSYFKTSLAVGLRYFGSSSSGSDTKKSSKSSVPKGKPRSSDTKQSDDEKNAKITHKPYLITSGNSTRLKNDKIRQLQQQGEDDRQQNEAMMATSVSY